MSAFVQINSLHVCGALVESFRSPQSKYGCGAQLWATQRVMGPRKQSITQSINQSARSAPPNRLLCFLADDASLHDPHTLFQPYPNKICPPQARAALAARWLSNQPSLCVVTTGNPKEVTTEIEIVAEWRPLNRVTLGRSDLHLHAGRPQ